MPQPWIKPEQLESPSDPMAEYAILMASYVLWGLSGRKYGGTRRTQQEYICDINDLPQNCSYDDRSRGYWNPDIGMETFILPAIALASPSGGLGGRFPLRNLPVRRVHSVSIAGSVLPSASYKVSNNRELRIAGAACTNVCAGMTVDYTYGVAAPAAGQVAAIELANELVRSWNNQACALPDRVKSVSRQGISFDMIDPMDFVDKGRTGLLKVDFFLMTANPGKAHMPAKIFSPDIPRGNHYTN